MTAPFRVVDDSGCLVMKVDTKNRAMLTLYNAFGASPFVESTHPRNEAALLRGFK